MITPIQELLNTCVSRTKQILKNNLTGIYLHGSAVMGCFNPEKSDLDFIVVINEALPDFVKKEYMNMIVDLNACGPAKGIEMSVVTKSVCNPFVYPTPFDLHFSIAHLNWYKSNPDDYIQKMKGTDKDLAAHFTIITNRGKCLYGEPIEKVFSKVPEQDYFDSIWNDIADAVEDISENTMYLTLNLARVLAYKNNGVILSKKEAGEWALKNLPEEYHPLIKATLKEYAAAVSVKYNLELAKQYAGCMLNRIVN